MLEVQAPAEQVSKSMTVPPVSKASIDPSVSIEGLVAQFSSSAPKA